MSSPPKKIPHKNRNKVLLEDSDSKWPNFTLRVIMFDPSDVSWQWNN